MAVQSRSEIIATHLNKTEEVIFPLIVHITPIWPPEKRIENVKARKGTFRRLVRNKMILFQFLQSINPSFKDFAVSEVPEKVDDKESIVTLTKNFREEQRQKHKRIYEIQMDAYLREERKKIAWGRVRGNECNSGWQKPPRTSLAASKEISNNSTVQTFTKDLQLTNEKYRDTSKLENVTSSNTRYRRLTKARKTRRSNEVDVVFPEQNDTTSSPQLYRHDKDVKRPVDDPRFERLMTSLVPSAKKIETDFSSRDTVLKKRYLDKASILQRRLNGKSLHEKWLETMEPKYNEKNASRKSIHN